ncbi:TetR family transcriptional regulator [Neisseria bacilliformis ATCC BAA-1200]|uniref:TetR family transcriptional regulator n=1 Tax=Neisseria bacilliformis ATCC BAA-1200 TaxID=888742 RepID=F2BBH1_9NEIS|nr:TetR family transcriptional regulator [Neisseria bacilliformis ATCC BAA-1200]
MGENARIGWAAKNGCVASGRHTLPSVRHGLNRTGRLKNRFTGFQTASLL